jgi:CheY-like chemotaxis protein
MPAVCQQEIPEEWQFPAAFAQGFPPNSFRVTAKPLRIAAACSGCIMKLRILVVDDQPPLARMLRLMLEQTGEFEVREVTHARYVTEAARIFKPDLVILDVEMPGKNGAEIARELTTEGGVPSSSIVFLSGLVDKHEAGIKQTPSGPMRFLSKTTGVRQTVRDIQEALLCLSAA